MKKSINKGFTLIELLVTIGIIGIILTISTISVISIINNSKKNNNKITINNIKAISEIYIKEYASEISWNEDNTTCIPIQTLVSKGYVKKEIFDNDAAPLSIILTKDEYNNIISEKEKYIDCNTYSRTVPIPTNEDICNNIPYDGNNHFLINQSISMNNYSNIEYLDTTYKNTSNITNHPKNAGEYKVSVSLADGKQWEDNTKNPKIVTCKIKKAIPDLSLKPTMGNSNEDIGTKEIILTSEVSGTVSIKSSNNNYVTAKVKDSNVITANNDKTIEITTIATRNSTTTVTITVTPTGEYKNNYKKASIVYTVGNINTITVAKPTTEDSCNNLIYNGNSQTLAKTNEAYSLVNNSAIEIGTYTVTARLKYGYVWDDNTTDNVEFSCEIQTPKPKVTYKNAVCNSSVIEVTYNQPYGENQSLCTPTKTGYTFNGWYSDNNYTNKVTNDTIVTNFNNHNLYAKWTANTYTIIYNCNNGTEPTISSTHTYDIEKNLTTNTCSKTGYTFSGWNTNSNGTGTNYSNNHSIINLTSENNKIITLYAKWSTNTYTVTFNPTEGTVSPENKNVTYNNTYGDLPTPTRTGYTFDGWFTASSEGTKITETSTVSITKDQTLYAHWTPNTYTVTFDANGGNNSTPNKNVTYNSTYGTLPTPTYEEYTFLGWYTALSGGTKITSNTKVEITETETLYAHWVKTSTSFNHTNNIQRFTVLVTGKYKLEVWGAQGGSVNGGKGGYSKGFVSLSANTILYIVVGNQPANFSGQGGYNGGGTGGNSEFNRGGGGGATHISKTSTLLKNTSVENLYIVAGGGGGGTYLEGESNTSAKGGTGGGNSGGTGGNSGTCIGTGADCFERFATGGSQTSGGIGGIGRDFLYNVYAGNNGSYGQGGNGDSWRPGGGGGYYGGGAAGVSAYYTSGGGGGSGYIGGVTDGYMENGVQSSNGKATITFIE